MSSNTNKTYNMNLSPEGKSEPYSCLIEQTSELSRATVRPLARMLLEQYGGPKMNIKAWRRMKPFTVSWTDTSIKPPQQRCSIQLKLDDIADHLIANLDREYSHRFTRSRTDEFVKPLAEPCEFVDGSTASRPAPGRIRL